MSRILDEDVNYRETVKKMKKQLERNKLKPSATLMKFVEEHAKAGKNVRELLGLFGIKIIRAGEMDKKFIASELKAVRELVGATVKKYKGLKYYYEKKYDTWIVVHPEGTEFVVGLDDSKSSGSRKMVEVGEKDAKKYIDYYLKNKKAVDKKFIASELRAVRELFAGKEWKLGDGWVLGIDSEEYVMYAVADMVEELGLNYRISKSEFDSEIKRTIDLPSNWGEREIKKLMNDLTDINYHSERNKIERELTRLNR